MVKNSMMKKLGGVAAVVMGTVACSQQPFKLIDPKAKKAFMTNNYVFNDKVRVAGDGIGTITEAGELANAGTIGSMPGATNNPPSDDGKDKQFCAKYPRLCINGQVITTIVPTQLSGASSGQVSSEPIAPSLISAFVDWVNQANQNGASIPLTITDQGNPPETAPSGSIGSLPLTGIQINGAISTETPNLDVAYLCSNARTSSVGGNVKSYTGDYTVRLLDAQTKAVVCEMTSADIRNSLLNEKKLPLPKDCAGLGSKPFHIELLADKNDPKTQLLYGTYHAINGYMTSPREPYMRSSVNRRVSLFVLYDKNLFSGSTDLTCDLRSSPLFVNMGGMGVQTELSPITDGVMFDILGKNAKPRPHTKKQISWFVDPNFMFLVKPNQRGQINGVDEMFGDNTQGPDGRGAADGFRALAKYDLNRDKVIDKDDAIFSQLRLWSDVNRDGIAAPGELLYLDFAGVEMIDLRFDPNYYERDKYGNEIKYKSVVKMKDDSLRLMFDLWFRYL